MFVKYDYYFTSGKFINGEKMTICKMCGTKITSNLVLNCTCGSFCSKECLDEYHVENDDEPEWEEI